jgi:dipeptide/tripeptide permease
MNESIELGEKAKSQTIGRLASWIGWLLLGSMMIITAIHAVNIVNARAVTEANGSMFWAIRIGGVVLVELFAAVTAVLLATNKLRASQKPAAVVVEGMWFVFAAVNLVASFSIEANEVMPGIVEYWVRFGLPVSALIVGSVFYLVYRLDPEAKRTADKMELKELFEQANHEAKVEVMVSPQMKTAMKQMLWQSLPVEVGREFGLNEKQIESVVQGAPELMPVRTFQGNGQEVR